MTRDWAKDPRNPKSPNYNPKVRESANALRKERGTNKTWAEDSRNQRNKAFGTVDGEGGNIPDPSTLFGDKHQYLLLRADEFTIAKAGGLAHPDCFDFLADLPSNRIWSGYFFDYDVTMMCRSMPEERARRLFDPTLRLRQDKEFSFPTIEVDGRWDVGYTPHKEFKVRRIGSGKPFTVVNDTGSFFQTSFVNTLRKWGIGTEEERDSIARDKARRSDFGELTPETVVYNELECRKHNELMEEFRRVCREVGYEPRKWQGPGHLASAMLAAHGVPRREEIPIMANWKFRALANAAYYGGRAETTAMGHIPGPVHQFDINGAYVYALQLLPCLIHGSWRFTRSRPTASVWVGNIEFRHAPGKLLYNLPVRRENGNIFFPRFGSGHYWSWELDAAESAGTRYDFKEGWVYEKHCDCAPFSWIPAYYQERLRLGKSGKGMVLKLGGNSIYGKIAQSIGYAPWANPVWAGLITAWCRATIIRAYKDNPDDVLMIMTDGIFMRHIPPLQVTNQLGDWELKTHESLFIVQPGIYFLPGSVKTRGVPLGRIEAVQDEFRARYEEFKSTGKMPEPVPIPVDNFITMRTALARRKWNIAGTWEHTTRDISYDWSTKRNPSGILRERDTGVVRTQPLWSSTSVASHPYDRIIGGSMNISPFDRYADPGLEEKINAEEQPDWNEPLFTMEG